MKDFMSAHICCSVCFFEEMGELQSMIMKNLVVAIDGPAGAGKSSVAKKVAELLGLDYLDTGAIYRALAFYLNAMGFEPVESPYLTEILSKIKVSLSDGCVYINGADVTEHIRSPRVDSIVSSYAALPTVRRCLLSIQREQAEEGGLVADGRDMGTVVFPDATIKIYLTASDSVRAKRRHLQLLERGEKVSFDEVLRQIQNRDQFDSNREIAPLCQASDAIFVDTSSMTEDEVVDYLVRLVKENSNQVVL